ncbi:MAG: methyltransferase domain-containing protein, partial [Trueperaceae bacterium]
MEEPGVDPVVLRRTYAQFGPLNDLVAGWRRAWRRTLAPAAHAAAAEHGRVRLLDVGCGGGDLIRRLCAWAAQDGVELHATGVDPDPVALAYARSRSVPPNVRYRQARAEELPDGDRFDLIVSNHLLHHLPEPELTALACTCERLRAPSGTVLHGDIHRNALALPAFALASFPFRRSFVREDGFRSIRRAWRPHELAPLLPPGWRAERVGRFRIQVGVAPHR